MDRKEKRSKRLHQQAIAKRRGKKPYTHERDECLDIHKPGRGDRPRYAEDGDLDDVIEYKFTPFYGKGYTRYENCTITLP
jgi:hypothetical protein